MSDENTLLVDALQAKIDAAKLAVETKQGELVTAQAVVIDLERQTSCISPHFGAYTLSQIKAEIESWFE